MPQMLGQKFLPESVQSRRRQLRNKVNNLRSPVRQKRTDLVPGPDIIGTAEDQLMGLRDGFVSRQGVLGRIKARRSDDSGTGSGEEEGQSQPAT